MAEVKRAILYRERKENPDGPWSSWSIAELGIPSLLAKAQDRPDEYEVEEVVGLASLPQAARDAIDGKVPDGLNGVEHVEVTAIVNALLDSAPGLLPEIRAGAEGWLRDHHPTPASYMAAMRSMASGGSTEEDR